ncbi:MAG: alpha/beta hydrolase [Solirubrobacterales bacterium]|nr:alpha/beta hydrolase [Solirubrobacterales bacterium]MCB8971139.1 alpha/beta hydrolase [Thermoleophilales bacterium]
MVFETDMQMRLKLIWTGLAVAMLTALALAPSAGAAQSHKGIVYDLDGTPVPNPPRLNQLDLYTPDDVGAGASRPVVVYVHGGGWATGDKSNKLNDKINLFTGAGYVFVSVNYRLANNPVDLSYPPTRVRFPTIPSDVAEALGWLDRNVAAYGGDPRRLLLMGHSAGAQLVSLITTDPSYVSSWGVDPAHLLGTVSLDTDTYDITERAMTGNDSSKTMIYNAVATPQENAVDGAWARYSATNYADPGDPDFLLVTQAGAPRRAANTEQMATLLGQDPATSVFKAPYDHEGINAAVGSPTDQSGETAAIMAFFASKAGPLQPATSRVTVLKRPKTVVKLRHGKRARVRFRFQAESGATSFACRIDKKKERRCASPKSYKVKPGRHTFRVVAVGSAGERGPVRKIGFRVVDKRR